MEMDIEWKKFSSKEKERNSDLNTKKMYVDLTGDLVTAHLLSQIIYWFLPGKNGQSKIRVFKYEKEWIAKKRTDWLEECRIIPSQYDRAIKKLKELELVETKVFKFNREPTCHISLNKGNLINVVDEYLFESKESVNTNN